MRGARSSVGMWPEEVGCPVHSLVRLLEAILAPRSRSRVKCFCGVKSMFSVDLGSRS